MPAQEDTQEGQELHDLPQEGQEEEEGVLTAEEALAAEKDVLGEDAVEINLEVDKFAAEEMFDEEEDALDQLQDQLEKWPYAPCTIIERAEEGIAFDIPTYGVCYIFLLFIAWIVMTFVTIVISVAMIHLSGDKLTPFVLFFMLAFPWTGMMGVPLFAAFTNGNGPFADYGVSSRSLGTDILWGIAFGFIVIISSFICGIFTNIVFGFESEQPFTEIPQVYNDPGFAFVMFVCVAIGAPIVEETAFRGMMFTVLALKGLPGPAIVAIVGIVFGIAHLEFPQVFALCVAGCILTFARLHTKSLLPGMIAHAMNNAFVMIIMLLVSGGDDEETRMTRMLPHPFPLRGMEHHDAIARSMGLL
jgi:membrane protease YdiL (CAAX protease family)